jgi:tol-pal system protein YbgF
MYQESYIDFSKGNYPVAITGFREFLRRYPDHALAGSAQYWIGEAQLGLARSQTNAGQADRATPALEHAVQEFPKVVANYPRSGKAPAALYKEALTLIELKQPGIAQARLQYLVDNFPQAAEASLARGQLAAKVRWVDHSSNTRRRLLRRVVDHRPAGMRVSASMTTAGSSGPEGARRSYATTRDRAIAPATAAPPDPAPVPSALKDHGAPDRSILDSAGDRGPESRPVRFGGDPDRSPDQEGHPAQPVQLLATVVTRLEVADHRARSPGVEGAVEVGAEASASQQTNHDTYWTATPRAGILMAP